MSAFFSSEAHQRKYVVMSLLIGVNMAYIVLNREKCEASLQDTVQIYVYS